MVPVLAAVPIETAIWIILVVIGVISSIVSNARKAVKAARAQGRPRLAPGVVAQAMGPAVIEPVEPPVPVLIRATPKRAAPAAAIPKAPEASGTQPFRGMFERGNLVRAIVAAEVLGPPKALQEQSIWSPRHNEPSI